MLGNKGLELSQHVLKRGSQHFAGVAKAADCRSDAGMGRCTLLRGHPDVGPYLGAGWVGVAAVDGLPGLRPLDLSGQALLQDAQSWPASKHPCKAIPSCNTYPESKLGWETCSGLLQARGPPVSSECNHPAAARCLQNSNHLACGCSSPSMRRMHLVYQVSTCSPPWQAAWCQLH